MAGDILIRLFERHPEETDPENLKGIVAIDELDVHIHPVPWFLIRTVARKVRFWWSRLKQLYKN